MRHFNTPPEWPEPPRRGWRPPRRWQPPENWPAAPAGWAFWVDKHGRAVRGPIGRYGGPGRVAALGIVAVPVGLHDGDRAGITERWYDSANGCTDLHERADYGDDRCADA